MDAIGLEKVYVIGNSFGGYVTWRFAADFPDRVNRFVLIAATGIPFDSKLLAKKIANSEYYKILHYLTPKIAYYFALSKAYSPDGEPSQNAVTRTYDLARRKGNRPAFVRLMREMYEDRDLTALDRVRALSLIVHGDNDQIVPSELGPQFLKHMKNSKKNMK